MSGPSSSSTRGEALAGPRRAAPAGSRDCRSRGDAYPPRHRAGLLALVAAGLNVVVACGPTGTVLRPAWTAHSSASGVVSTAYTVASGVVVKARGDSWSGDADVKDHVTPMQIQIENRSKYPLQIRYSNISLVSADGREFRAIPPSQVRGTVEMNVSVVEESELGKRERPAYVYRNVAVEAPPAYQGLPYYDHLYDNWTARIPLPTKHMKRVALPQALVPPQEQVSGFVYFERVPEMRNHVSLNVDLVNANTGDVFGTAEIAFVVD